ncbi:hypothetical protein GCM10027596_14740 [Nocardioides korecus]
MSSQPHDDPTGAPAHPLVDLVDRLRTRLDRLTGPGARPVWGLTDPEKRHVLVELAAITNQLDAVRLDVLAEAERTGATEASGARSAADWVAIETRQRRPHARADLHLATQLKAHRPLHDAVAAGGVNTDQARAILASLDLLPTTGDLAVTPEQRLEAEHWLIGQAAHHDATALRTLGRHLLEVICPDQAEEIEGRLLEAEEAAAARRTTFTIREDDQGTCHGRFRIPTRHGHMLAKMLQSLTPPPSNSADVESQPLPVRLGIAFTDLIERIPATALPTSGGVGATVVVTMTLDQLLARLDTAGVCTLDTGARLTAAEARRLAARARGRPARPGRGIGAAGRRPHPTSVLRSAADRAAAARPALHSGWLRHPTRAVPRPPRPALVHRRAHRPRQRPIVVRSPPQAGPRPRVPPRTPPRRHDPLPPARVSHHPAHVSKPQVRPATAAAKGLACVDGAGERALGDHRAGTAGTGRPARHAAAAAVGGAEPVRGLDGRGRRHPPRGSADRGSSRGGPGRRTCPR